MVYMLIIYDTNWGYDAEYFIHSCHFMQCSTSSEANFQYDLDIPLEVNPQKVFSITFGRFIEAFT